VRKLRWDSKIAREKLRALLRILHAFRRSCLLLVKQQLKLKASKIRKRIMRVHLILYLRLLTIISARCFLLLRRQ